MALSYISYASAAATSRALPTFAVGDLALVFAYRDGSNTAPSLPAGWTNIASSGADTNSARLGYRTLQVGDTTTGVWTSATEVAVLVLRGQHPTIPLGPSVAANGAVSNTVTYGQVAIDSDPITSWVVGFAGHRTATDAYTVISPAVFPSGTLFPSNTAPAGTSSMTNRSLTTGGSTPSVMCHTQADSFAFVSPNYTFPPVDFTVNATSGWRSYAIKINEALVNQTQTAVASVSLAPVGAPVTRTSHVLNIRARKTLAAHTGVMRVQLFENGVPRTSLFSTSALTTSLADYALPIPDAEAVTIGSYAELEVRFQGYSSEGTATIFEVDQVWLTLPAAATVTSSVFPSVLMFTLVEEWAVPVDDIFPSPSLYPSETAPGATPEPPPGQTSQLLDSFDRANTGPPPSASWGNMALSGNTGFKVISNQAAPNTGDATSYWSAATFGPDCECYVTLAALQTGEQWRGLWLRVTNPTTSPNGYFLEFGQRTGYVELGVFKCVAGVITQLGGFYNTPYGVGDTIMFRATGTLLNGYQKPVGGTYTEVLAYNDSTFTAAGYIGMYASSTSDRLDNFGGGTL